MASEPLLNTRKYTKSISYRNIFYHKFFVVLLLFIVICLVCSLIFIVLSGSNPRKDYHEPVKLNVESRPIVSVNEDGYPGLLRWSNCTHWDCFNVYRCGRGGHEKITVYIYPLEDYRHKDGNSISQFSREFYLILDAIRSSRYYTPNPEEACILVPSIDTLNQHTFFSKPVSQVLHQLKHWNEGENHLIFNMLPGSAPNYNTVVDLNTGKALIAGSGFDTWTFRYGFDISFPVYSHIASKIDKIQPKEKSYLIISAQTNIPADYQTILQNLASSSTDLLLLEQCSDDFTKRCEFTSKSVYSYPEVLKQGVYCLVIRSARLSQAMLLDVIASQCIPIIIADGIIMPFNSHIDWQRLSLFIAEENISKLVSIIHSVSEERRTEMFWQLRWIYDRYFSSIKKTVLTTLDILNERVFPLSGRVYEDWNLPEHLYGPVNPLFLPVTAPKAPGFTAVILTYDRLDSLFTLVKRLARVPSLSKILVVWNNQKLEPPHLSEWPDINKPLKIIRTRANKLSNRFFPYDEIETECQLTIDDDINMLTTDELEFGFDVWREFPDRIVGFPSRLHVWDNVTMTWKYHSEWTNQISMVLTGAAFHHKIWSHYYTYKMPAEIKEWVDTNFNCEDIAINFLVANVTKKPPIKVTPRKKFKCPECVNTEMLSADARHMSQRSYCINYFTKVYGNMALIPIEFRADPLQYKETGTGIPLVYPDIGAL